jgi:hypothetical protein
VVRCADTDSVYVFPGQKVAKIAVLGACVIFIGLVDAILIGLSPGLHWIADSYNTGVLLSQKGLTVVRVDITSANKA